MIDLHTQLIFICLTILQKNEFKLLEYEEREVLEFLNNVPILSKYDDLMYKNLPHYNFELTQSAEVRPTDFSDKDSLYSINSETELSNLGNTSHRLDTFTSTDQFYNSLLSPTTSYHTYTPNPTPGFLTSGVDTDNESQASDVVDDFKLRMPPPTTPIKPSLRNPQGNEHPPSALSRPPSVQNKLKQSKFATGNGRVNKKIEFGTDDKTLHSFNEIMSGGGDVWRKWAYQELEQSNVG